jgi:dihydroneopterin aldolase
MVCQAYPALLVDDLLCVESSACTCRRWSTVDLDHDSEVARLEQVLREAAEYSEIVAAWNQSLEQEPHMRTYQDFCAYVLDAYASRYGAA